MSRGTSCRQTMGAPVILCSVFKAVFGYMTASRVRISWRDDSPSALIGKYSKLARRQQ